MEYFILRYKLSSHPVTCACVTLAAYFAHINSGHSSCSFVEIDTRSLRISSTIAARGANLKTVVSIASYVSFVPDCRVSVYRRVFRPFFLNDAPSGIQRMERKRNSRTSRALLHPPETCFTCKLGRLALKITRIFSRYDL